MPSCVQFTQSLGRLTATGRTHSTCCHLPCPSYSPPSGTHPIPRPANFPILAPIPERASTRLQRPVHGTTRPPTTSATNGWRGPWARLARDAGARPAAGCPGEHPCLPGSGQGAGQDDHPAPADAETVARRTVAREPPDCARTRCLHCQGLARPCQTGRPVHGPAPCHLPERRHPAPRQPAADGEVAVHHAVDEDTVCSTRPYGTKTVGVDKGCTEACTDSEGKRHGGELGDLLAEESNHVKAKGGKGTVSVSLILARGLRPRRACCAAWSVSGMAGQGTGPSTMGGCPNEIEAVPLCCVHEVACVWIGFIGE